MLTNTPSPFFQEHLGFLLFQLSFQPLVSFSHSNLGSLTRIGHLQKDIRVSINQLKFSSSWKSSLPIYKKIGEYALAIILVYIRRTIAHHLRYILSQMSFLKGSSKRKQVTTSSYECVTKKSTPITLEKKTSSVLTSENQKETRCTSPQLTMESWNKKL